MLLVNVINSRRECHVLCCRVHWVVQTDRRGISVAVVVRVEQRSRLHGVYETKRLPPACCNAHEVVTTVVVQLCDGRTDPGPVPS
jgi:hypothetical protein